MQLLAFLGALALLVCNTTAGLAGRLAGGLAFAAATVLCAVAQVAGLNGLDMFHNFTFHINLTIFSLAQSVFHVNHIFHTFHTIHHIAHYRAHIHHIKMLQILGRAAHNATVLLDPSSLLCQPFVGIAVI